MGGREGARTDLSKDVYTPDTKEKQYHARRKILVVDDEPDITSSFEQALRDNGLEVEIAND